MAFQLCTLLQWWRILFIPYFVAIGLLGIPFLILEYGLGFKFKTSFSNLLHKIRPRFEVIGWILGLLAFGVVTYYMVILAWDIVYLGASPFLAWGLILQDFS